MKRTKSIYLALLAVLLLPMAANATPISEIDAGNTAGTAQVVPGGTTLISGNLEAFGAADLYQIGWGGGLFQAWTYSGLGGGAFGSFDTMLSLFDLAGNLVLFNDDYLSLQSFIQGTVGAGTYYLGITNYRTCYGANLPCFGDTVVSGGYYANYAVALSETSSTAVPEPGTLALLGLGLVGIAARRRKKV